MKKRLLALAALSAASGIASAQSSSVTLFGVVDLNLRYVNNEDGTQYQMSQDGLASSRLGFRGTEDLGGGLSASFWIEGALNPDTGTPLGQTWQRRSTVSLSGGFGEVRLGRDYTSTFWNLGIFDPFGTVGLGNAGNLVLVPGTFGANVPTGGAYGTLVRDNNMVGYFLPSGIAGGLYGQFQVAAGENSLGTKYVGGRVGYASGPFNAAVAYGKTQVTSDLDGTQFNLGGSWNFGVVMLSGYYGNIDIGNLSQDNWFIGATAPIGVWTLKASYGQVSRSGAEGPVNIEGQKANMVAVGAVYDLSKRTSLYSTWSGINNKDGARFIVAPLQNVGPLGGSAPNGNSQGFEFGIKHSF
jgi:predicted porin